MSDVQVLSLSSEWALSICKFYLDFKSSPFVSMSLVAFSGEGEDSAISKAWLDFDLFSFNDSPARCTIEVVRISGVTNSLQGSTIQLLHSAGQIHDQVSWSVGSRSILGLVSVTKDATKNIGSISLELASQWVLALNHSINDFL